MVEQKGKALKICYCSFPFPTESTRVHTIGVVKVLRAIATRLCVVAARMPEGTSIGQEVNTRNLRVVMHSRESIKPAWFSVLKWALKYVAAQVEMSYHLIRISNQADIVIFYEGPHYLLPVIVARLFRKKIVKYSPATIVAMHSYPKLSIDYWASYISRVSERVVHSLSDRIIIPTESCIRRIGLEKYQGKISVAMYTYVSDIYQDEKDWHGRNDTIGYVGRLIEIRGVLKLAQAIPLILREKKDTRFLIVGDGVLMADMKRCLDAVGCLDKVDFVGWVPNERIPHYLNEMKFHVSPSYWDVPGTVNLEAMACGTVAIANDVGGVPDVVIDNETGFLLKDNEPRTIARKVIEVWDHPELEKIRRNAGVFVEQNFSYQKVVDNWRRVLSEL